MARPPLPDLLPPNTAEGSHQRRGERIEGMRVEIGRAKRQDFLVDCTLVGCDIRIRCGASHVNLFGSTFERCRFLPGRPMMNLRLTGMNLRGCAFEGKYIGCRFGNEEEDHDAEVRDCDFRRAAIFHLCDFLGGTDVASCRWPTWPHIVVTDLERSARSWSQLPLPEGLQLVQQTIAEGPPARAVTIHLPSETERAEELRDRLSAQPYILVAEPADPSAPNRPQGPPR
ncbi:MAG: hypothetical protein U0800_23755 [Isosphaeraceae bacterium]